MKTIPILMPQMGQSMAEGTIIKWRKKVGDPIKADEIILEVESDKISIEVESPVAGKLTSCHKSEGDVAAVGDVVGLIETASEMTFKNPADPTGLAKETRKNMPHAAVTGEQQLVSAAASAVNLDDGALPEITRDWFSPYLLRLAMLNNVTIQELQAIRGTGRQGRVTRNDLLKFLSRRPANGSPAPALRAELDSMPDNVADLGEVIPMTSMRRTIADHMVQSIHTSAHVTMVHAVDMTHIVNLRERIKDSFLEKFQVKMTYTGVMIFVTARVLRDFPVINGSVHGSNIVVRKDVNIGCAVALQDESLVVPVIKHADQKSFPEIAQELDTKIGLARKKSLARSDIDDGTFTISNFGAFGSLIGTPIINQPQVAILGMGAVFKAPVVIDGKIEIRDQVYLSFSFDHRVIDGAMGGRFLNTIQKTTEALTEESLDLAKL
ncbi:MAG TPA: dihydrolipoamide acetyltransferase family protein [Kiritimatiellia bacterium]